MEIAGRRVLAFGTRGAQGSGLAEALEAASAVPVLVSSSPHQVETWRTEGREAIHADLMSPESVASLTTAADAAVLHLPFRLYGPPLAAVIESATRLAALGLRVSVNLGAPVPPPDVPDHQGSRARAEALLGAGVVVVTPTAYLENHLLPPARRMLLDGELVYPLPEAVQLAWITSRDVTRAAVAGLSGPAGRLYGLAGPEVLSFGELARALAAGSGRAIRFRQITPAAYADMLRPIIGDQGAAGVEQAYSSMPPVTSPMMAFDASDVWGELGIKPTYAREWAADHLRDDEA
jgi:uncharacterized protein YbjT (DUF2867 family)